MSTRPAAGSPLPSPVEMAQLVAQAGLALNAGQMADLALAWRQLVGLLARIPRDRPLLDDQAYVFRLPAPVVPAESAAPKSPAVAKQKAAKPKSPSKPAAKPKLPSKPAAKAKTAAPRRATSRRA